MNHEMGSSDTGLRNRQNAMLRRKTPIQFTVAKAFIALLRWYQGMSGQSTFSCRSQTHEFPALHLDVIKGSSFAQFEQLDSIWNVQGIRYCLISALRRRIISKETPSAYWV
jgi:hypothetical protein